MIWTVVGSKKSHLTSHITAMKSDFEKTEIQDQYIFTNNQESCD